jgi:hypothetical protein
LPPARVVRRANDGAKGLITDSLEILEPSSIREEHARSIAREHAIGELVLPLYMKSPLPKIVFASDFKSESLQNQALQASLIGRVSYGKRAVANLSERMGIVKPGAKDRVRKSSTTVHDAPSALC